MHSLRSIIHYVCSIAYLCVADAAVVAVYSLQRHGARNVLPKGIDLTEKDLIGGPTLLPEGQFQTYTAGTAFRQRYMDNVACLETKTCLTGVNNGIKYGVMGQPGVGFGNFDVYVRSSSLDRTIMSALCFFGGIFPADPAAPTNKSYLPTGAQVVPMYTVNDTNDVLIRAYTKCPTYQARLESWFQSTEFKAKAMETAALRAAVQQAVPTMNTSLENWWNVYDAINVYQTYGVGDPVPPFNATQFGQIQDLANWLEVSKMRSNITGNLLGGVMLADVVSYLQAAANAVRNNSQVYYRLVSLSGHYNTQLGLLAALQLDTWNRTATFDWFRNIPKLAAVMVFELHSSASASGQPSFYVRLAVQDGYRSSYIAVPLPCESDAAQVVAGDGACELGDFVTYMGRYAISTPEAWCDACGNQDMDRCAVAAATAALVKAKDDQAWKIAVSVVVTFVGTVFCTVLVMWLLLRRCGSGAGGGGGSGGGGRHPAGRRSVEYLGDKEMDIRYTAAHSI